MQVEHILHLALSITCTSHVVSFDKIILYFSQLCVLNAYIVKLPDTTACFVLTTYKHNVLVTCDCCTVAH